MFKACCVFFTLFGLFFCARGGVLRCDALASLGPWALTSQAFLVPTPLRSPPGRATDIPVPMALANRAFREACVPLPGAFAMRHKNGLWGDDEGPQHVAACGMALGQS